MSRLVDDQVIPTARSVVLVAAMAANRVIGAGNTIPWHHREDLRRFKRLTLGKTMIMGRLTYESIGRPLPGRRTIVITRDPVWSADGVEVAHGLGDALDLAGDGEVIIAGGGQVYAEALPLADRMELTRLDAEIDGDVVFPAFDPDDWEVTAEEPGEGLRWISYRRVGPPSPA